MRLGIRAKLIGTLLLAGLLPLALALGVILFGVVELRIHASGRMYRALAVQQAGHLSTILASQVDLANLVNALPGTAEFLERANQAPPLTQREINRIEMSWPMLRPDEPGLLRDCLENEIARRWQSIARTERRFSEVMVTDSTGRLVAATNKTSDYFQADEQWWQDCYDDGRGRVLISDVQFDESAISAAAAAAGGRPGTLVADLCLPIYEPRGTGAPGAAGAGAHRVIGVMKISLDASWMLRQIDPGAHDGEDLPRATWLVRSDGRAVPGGRSQPPVPVLPPHVARRVADEPSGWLNDRALPGNELLGYAAVEQSRIIHRAGERWHVVVASGRREVVASLHRMAWLIFGLGLLVITACYFGGWYLARREIVRPLRRLTTAVNRIRGGDRDFRLSEARGRAHEFRDDEIGGLAHDVNAMADQIRDHLERLEHADAIKRQFIDLASHELRTPVTYILGATQLAQRQQQQQQQQQLPGPPPSTNGTILSKIAAKAQRLSRIVENMFKLLASDRFERAPRTADVTLGPLIAAVCQEHEPFLHERGQHWQLDVSPDLPTIVADADKVRDILGNLVSNAIRFSPDGGSVGVRAARTDTPAPGVEIVVSDSGNGIPAADLPNLFQPFFTGGNVDRHTSGDYQHMSRGIGLGLSVVKRFVDLHAGTVSVDTAPGAGTRIRVTLPLDTSNRKDVKT